MKFLILICVSSLLVSWSFQQETGTEKTPAGGDASDAKTSEAQAAEENKESTGSTTKAPSDKPSEGDAKTPENVDASTGENNSSETTGQENANTNTNMDLMLFKNLSKKCKDNIMFCFGDSSPNNDIKGKDISKKSEMACDYVGKAQACLKAENEGNTCTMEEFTQIKDAVCFSPRVAASILLVLFLCVFSKFLGHH